jgi:hypothetical protein
MKLVALFLISLLPSTYHRTDECEQLRPWLDVGAQLTGWDTTVMQKIAWRESRCLPMRSETSDSGHLQINDINHRFLSEMWGMPVDSTMLMDPAVNVLAAAELFNYWERVAGDGYLPWAATR